MLNKQTDKQSNSVAFTSRHLNVKSSSQTMHSSASAMPVLSNVILLPIILAKCQLSCQQDDLPRQNSQIRFF